MAASDSPFAATIVTLPERNLDAIDLTFKALDARIDLLGLIHRAQTVQECHELHGLAEALVRGFEALSQAALDRAEQL